MQFAPLAGELEGKARKWGKHLLVTDSAGELTIVADMRSNRSGDADVWNAEGAWRIHDSARFGVELHVIDSSGAEVATMPDGRDLELVGGETLTWAGPRLLNHACGFVEGLWVAKKRWGPGRRFRAELSTAMLAREDRGLLAAVAAVLTCRALLERSGGGMLDIGDIGTA